MGIRSWWRHRRARRSLAQIAGARGKSMEDLAREGGWDVLATAGDWVRAEDIWRSFSKGEQEDVYRKSSIVYACVRKIASVAPDAYMEVGRWDGDEWSPEPGHALVELLRHPNPRQDWREFCFTLAQHLLLTGESPVWKRRNRAGFIEEVHALPTSWVTPETDGQGRLSHYGVRVGGGDPVLVPLEDLFVWTLPDPSRPGVGAGPLQAALRDLQVDDARAAMMIELLTNTHFAGTILRNKDMWTEDQKDEMRRVLRDVIGPGKRGQPLFVHGEGEVEFPDPKSDMDWPGTANLSEARICATFGVPPILIGLRVGLERSTFSNVQESRQIFRQSTMRAHWQSQASVLERGLLRDEGEDAEIEADWDHIPEMQEDVDKLHSRALKDFHGGLLTLNRTLEIIGEPEADEGGDVRVIPMNLVEFSPGAPEPEPAEGAPEEEHEEEWEAPPSDEEGEGD